MITRSATSQDISALVELDEQSAPVDAIDGVEARILDKPDLLEWMLQHDGIVVAIDEGRVVGYVLSHVVKWMHGIPELVWLEHIGVHPDFRRRGVALALLEAVSSKYHGRASCLHASIHPKNLASLRLMARLHAETGERVLAYVQLSSPTRAI